MNQARRSIDWSFEALWGLFVDMVQAVSQQDDLCIIIDALDECVDECGLVLLENLTDLSKQFAYDGDDGNPPRLIVTGRREELVFDLIEPSQHLEIKPEDTKTDLHSLVLDGVRTLATRRSLGAEIQDVIRHTLQNEADGMFIWVVLILKELATRDRRITEESVLAKLKSLPRKLADIYESILESTPGSRRREFWTIIRWLLYARGQLGPRLLRELVCAELDIPTWQDFEADVAVVCGSFIQIEAAKVSLIHQSARDFLLQHIRNVTPSETSNIDLSASQAEAALAEVCITILLKDNKIQSLGYGKKFPRSGKGFQAMRDFVKEHPTFAYAAQHWADHLYHVQTVSPELLALTKKLLLKQNARDAIMRLNYNFRYPGQLGCPADASTLHLASYFGLHFLLEAVIKEGCNVNLTSNASDSPLIWAAEMGSLKCAETLLQ